MFRKQKISASDKSIIAYKIQKSIGFAILFSVTFDYLLLKSNQNLKKGDFLRT